MRPCAYSLLLFLLAATTPGQAPGQAPGQTFPGQTFEVASIRPSGPKSIQGDDGGPGTKDPTRYTYGQADLEILLMTAYDLDDFQVSSKQPLDRDRFDVVARVPANATKHDFRVMLQNLLAERFQMKLHFESREFPALELVVAQGGTKLGTPEATRLASAAGFPQIEPGRPAFRVYNSPSGSSLVTRIRGQQQPVSEHARILRTIDPRPVVDKTGLTGNFDFALQFSTPWTAPGTNPENAVPSDLPDVNTALREQLGPRLIPKKLPFNVVAVESFNRIPTEN